MSRLHGVRPRLGEMSAKFCGKYVNDGVMVYHLFITNLRGYQNCSKDRGHSDRAKMTSILLFTGYELDENL